MGASLSSSPQGCQRTEPGLTLWDPIPGSPSPQALARPPSTTYVTSGPSVAAGEQALLLNF